MMVSKAGLERRRDIWAALFAAAYLLAALAFFAWQLFDVWSEKYFFLQEVLMQGILQLKANDAVSDEKLASGVFRTLAFAVAGGGMGGAINGLRSIIDRHADPSNPKRFEWRFAYVYLFLPPLGATLGLIVVALTRTGIGVLSGEGDVSPGTGPAMSSLAIGFLAGYGSGRVFIWLDSRVTAVFRPSDISVPSLYGKTLAEAHAELLAARLNLSRPPDVLVSDAAVGTVIDQEPDPFSKRPEGAQVKVTIAAAPPAPPPPQK